MNNNNEHDDACEEAWTGLDWSSFILIGSTGLDPGRGQKKRGGGLVLRLRLVEDVVRTTVRSIVDGFLGGGVLKTEAPRLERRVAREKFLADEF